MKNPTDNKLFECFRFAPLAEDINSKITITIVKGRTRTVGNIDI